LSSSSAFWSDNFLSLEEKDLGPAMLASIAERSSWERVFQIELEQLSVDSGTH
jgi:hypothetical protein